MRSRYCGYVVRDAAYLLATWHASTRPRRLDFPVGLRWLGLTVVRHEQVDANPGRQRPRVVTARTQQMHEVSRFVRQAACWYYLDGDVT